MTAYATMSFDRPPPPHYHHRTIYSNRTYARTTMTTTTTHVAARNPPYQPIVPMPAIDFYENLLYDVQITDDVGSATSSSYVNSSEHYDNAFTNTYDNPMDYHETYRAQQSLMIDPYDNETLYDPHRGKDGTDVDKDHCTLAMSRSTSSILFYLENKNLAICVCVISLLLLLIIGLGIFLLNKLFRPIVINTTVYNHYDLMNVSNTTTATMASSTLVSLLRHSTIDDPTTIATTVPLTSSLLSCPPDRWGSDCTNICKPCGLGVCQPTTGTCLCPIDIYGEFCDLWKVNDKPKRGDMTS